MGFLLSALVMWVMERSSAENSGIGASMIIGLVVCYAFGTAWFMIVYTGNTGAVGLASVLGWCVVPFLIPDFIKIALAFILSKRLEKLIER